MSNIRFGTDGWRAVIADQFTMENFRVVIQAIACYTFEIGMQDQPILVGHDTRFLGRRFAEEAAKVLAANGLSTYLVNEAVPTPAVAFGVKHFAASGAVMITASHNPPEYNGVKYIPYYGGPATPAITARLEDWISRIAVSREVRTCSLRDAEEQKRVQLMVLRPHYEAHLRRMVRLDVLNGASLSVVVDAMHGSGMGYVSGLLREAGVLAVGIREYPDPAFGGGLPDPTDRHLSSLKEEVVRRQAAMGLANDGDADRFGLVDETGSFVPPNDALALLTYHLVKNRKLAGRVVRTVATTHLLDRLAAAYGLEVVETPIGFKYIGAHIREGNVLIGGEESGGASILGHIPEKDGVLMNLLLAELCAWEGKPIGRILRDVQDRFGQMFHTRLDIPLGQKTARLEQLIASVPRQIGPFPVVEKKDLDGVKLLLAGGHWVLVRPLRTEPLVRVYCEAASRQTLEQLKEAIHDWLSEVEV